MTTCPRCKRKIIGVQLEITTSPDAICKDCVLNCDTIAGIRLPDNSKISGYACIYRGNPDFENALKTVIGEEGMLKCQL